MSITPEKITRIRLALPSGSFTRLAERTGHEYQLVHRTLHAQIKRWNHRHDEVITEAEKILKERGIELV